jgi:chromosome segregation ATPase
MAGMKKTLILMVLLLAMPLAVRAQELSYGQLKALYIAKEQESRELGEKIASFTGELKELQQLAGQLKKEKDELNRSKLNMQSELEQLRSQPEREPGLNEKVGVLERSLKQEQDFSAQILQEKARLQLNVQGLRAQLKELEDQKTTLSGMNRELAAKNESLEKDFIRLSALAEKLSRAGEERDQLQAQLDAVKKEKDELAGRLALDMNQHQQEIALLKTATEQELEQKEGALVRMSAKLAKLKAAQQVEMDATLQKLGSTQKELVVQKELSMKLVQEKAVSENLQAGQIQKITALDKQRLLAEQERDKLSEQNQFLKNQYVGISQEVNNLRVQYTKLLQEKQGVVPSNAKELQDARREMEQGMQSYGGMLKEYEQKLKNKEGVELQNKMLAQDFAKLKEAYVRLERKYGDAEQVVQRHELLKEKYASLPQENTTLHYNLGVLYAQNQQYDKAVTEFDKVLELKPEDIETLYNLGVIFGEQFKDRKKAIGYFKRYLALAPDDADSQRVRKFVLTWETYEQEIKDAK